LSARLRVWIVVAIAAAAAVGLAVGVTLATRTGVPHTGTVESLRVQATQHPRSALVRLQLGNALQARGDQAGAIRAWREAVRVQPDSPAAVHAEDRLHPDEPPGNPPFIPAFSRPRTPVQRLLARGIAYQAALRPLSAERAFAAAARSAPHDAEAQVAAAVGLFDKSRPAVAFSRLGPLLRRFPHAQTVRFHLGLLLIFVRDFPAARRELRLAVAEGPRTLLGRRARLLLKAGSKA
jgi:tetratricopeptide (TPR) repeat protein